jgi:hypothetical protein
LVRYLFFALALSTLAACTTGMRGSSRRICYDAGFQPHTQAFTDCWHRIRDEQFAVDGPILLGILGVAAAAATPTPGPPYRLMNNASPQPLQCIYWTPQGRRVVLAVNGLCPAHYGQ